jgi:hypothetical protein
MKARAQVEPFVNDSKIEKERWKATDFARRVTDAVGFCCKVSFSEVLGYCLSLRVAVGR